MATQNSINNSIKITRFTSSDTWTKDPRAQYIKVYVCCGGSGGGSGRQGLTGLSSGGGAGSPGTITFVEAPAIFFGSTESVVVGDGGLGGAAQASADTDGNPGNPGGISSFGSIEMGPDSQIGGGGGTVSGGDQGGQGTGWLMGGAIPFQPSFSGGGTLMAGAPGLNIGSDSGTTSGAAYICPTGAGGGGGADSLSPYDGGKAGDYNSLGGSASVVLVPGGSGGSESGTVDGGNGVDAATITSGAIWFAGTGGGGGAGQSAGPAAGNGGNGGIPGGPGGGGGGSLNGTDSGAGGNGARGEVVVIEYF